MKTIAKKIFAWINSIRYGSFGADSRIVSPLRIQGFKNIFVGNNVRVNKHSWLASLPLTNMGGAELTLKDNCTIGDFNHIWATHSIVIEEFVLTANHVYITDNLHEYEDINVPICDQPIKQLNDVVIGMGAWLGENVCIIGASVGKHSVVGANSVVTHDIPDYCVAVGSPARIIKRYNFETSQWEKTDKEGNFLVMGG